jgi:hypothetical protein
VDKIPEPPRFKQIIYEDWGSAAWYFKENLERIRRVLKAREKSREEGDAFISRQMLEFSAVLLVSAFEGYCFEKLREITGKEPKRYYSKDFPNGWIKAFRKLARFEMLKVGLKAGPEDSRKLKMEILAKKRNCIIHWNSKVSPQLQDVLKQEVAIGAKIPLDDAEIVQVMEIMKECVLKVENKYPSPVEWGKEGLRWLTTNS